MPSSGYELLMIVFSRQGPHGRQLQPGHAVLLLPALQDLGQLDVSHLCEDEATGDLDIKVCRLPSAQVELEPGHYCARLAHSWALEALGAQAIEFYYEHASWCFIFVILGVQVAKRVQNRAHTSVKEAFNWVRKLHFFWCTPSFGLSACLIL